VACAGCGVHQQWRTGHRQGHLEHIEQEYGIDRLLGELAVELRDGSYRPMLTRRVWIPKPGTSEQRPLSIPTEAA